MTIDQPAPEITSQTKLLSIDAESNGLHGPVFAIGAVLMRADGSVIDEFSGRCAIRGAVDPWVEKRVLPALTDLPESYSSARKLRDAFWEWYKQAKEQADYVLVSNGYPVEYRLLITCQEDDLEARYWDHPYPLLDLASMLLQVGVKPLAVRYQFVADEIGIEKNKQHHPRFDAWVSALAAFKAWRLSGQLKD